MKTFFLICIVCLFGCSTSGNQSSVTAEHASAVQSAEPVTNSSPPKLNSDSLKRLAAETKKHFELVTQLFNTLHLDSLKASDGEAYRMVVSRELSSEDIGNPISITFYKKNNKYSFEIHEIFASKSNSVKTKTHSASLVAFDSISNMFGQYFWGHAITDYNCQGVTFGSKVSLYESFKNGKHKLISQSGCKDEKLLPLAFFNFFIFAEYSKSVVEDFIWFKNNPPGHITSPGPPSSLKNK
ncbi:MAG TPA: hypothetical protein VN026_18980 [Bacteroidia bacterium]|jgi:hypothetical protein|nr:hypothetical protein [Bacteroidia bacterium]